MRPAHDYLEHSGHKPATRKTLRSHLVRFCHYFHVGEDLEIDWSKLSVEHVKEFIGVLKAHQVSTSSLNGYLCALHGAANMARRQSKLNANIYCEMIDIHPASIKVDKKTTKRVRKITDKDITALARACLQDKERLNNKTQIRLGAARDLVIIALVHRLGLSRSKIAQLEWDDYNPELKTLKTHDGKSHTLDDVSATLLGY